MLEEDDRPAIGGMGGEIALEPRQSAHRALVLVASETLQVYEMKTAPVPGIAVRQRIVIRDRHRRLVENGLAMGKLDIVSQFPAIPVGIRRRPVLVEVMVSKADINGNVDMVRARRLLVSALELL